MKLTTAQALVAWLIAQWSENLDGIEVPLFPAVFGIFGHGNVLGLGTALQERREEIPLWRGQTEEGMALAAVGLAKAAHRRQVGVATSSIGPGALNMVTAAGVAHANRLPLLLLPGDTFVSRAPDPVLQQVEHYGDPTITVNDAFRPVSRFFDRITRPEQLLATLPQVARVLTDPADAGPVTLALPQDIQAETYDFPDSLFEPVVHRIPRPRPDLRDLHAAAEALRSSRRPLLVLGGGVRYSGAGDRALEFAARHGIPVTETTAGRTLVPHDHPLYAGPLGVTGAASANTLAAEADLVLAVGTRLQDFTTASWTVFAPDVRLVHINAARFDAVKHGGLAVVADAAAALEELAPLVGAVGTDQGIAAVVSAVVAKTVPGGNVTGASDSETAHLPEDGAARGVESAGESMRPAGPGWQADPGWSARALQVRAEWDAHIGKLRASAGGTPSYAQIVGVVNELSGPADYVMTASGGLPGEVIGGWRATGGAPTMDVEYGFSCMGYELAGAWGAALLKRETDAEGLVTTLLGDGSYLMLNSELFSAAFAGHPLVAVVCDNDGFAVIARLQEGQGGEPYNNFLADCRTRRAEPPRVDFAAHARALGCAVFTASDPAEFRDGYSRARAAAVAEQRPAVVVVRTRPADWTEAGAWWEVGVPQHLSGRAAYDAAKPGQVRYIGRG